MAFFLQLCHANEELHDELLFVDDCNCHTPTEILRHYNIAH